jgi:hypothetical protein
VYISDDYLQEDSISPIVTAIGNRANNIHTYVNMECFKYQKLYVSFKNLNSIQYKMHLLPRIRSEKKKVSYNVSEFKN